MDGGLKPVGRRVAELAVLALPLSGCGGADGGPAGGSWAGTVDTLPSGQVVVHNPAEPMWPAGSEWRVEEELRIGAVEGDGPNVFGRITSLEVDRSGRTWVLDIQAQEVRVFDEAGGHVRTVGRRGNGPGELSEAMHVALGPEGRMWIMDPGNNRLSVVDTAGSFVEEHSVPGGFSILPWPGGFDVEGHYYAPVPDFSGDFRVDLVRFDASLEPVDTLVRASDPIERDRFEISGDGFRVMAGVPYQGGLRQRLSLRGTTLALLSDRYLLFELDAAGDTLRSISKEFSLVPVTAEDRERAREDLEWFTRQGGTIDLSRLPAAMPPVDVFFEDDEGNVWVELRRPGDAPSKYDVFDAQGRYLGIVTLPFDLLGEPVPIVRGDLLYGVAPDALDVPHVVRARIIKP